MRLLRWALGGLLLLVLVLGLLIWGAGSADGLGWLARQLAGAQIEGGRGSLWQGLQAERLRLELPGLRIEAEGIDWQPQAVGPRRLDGALQLRRLRLTPLGPPGAPLTEAKLRESLRLPLALRLAPLRVGRFEWADRLALTELGTKELALVDGGLRLDALRAQWPRADGVLTLQGSAQLAQQLRLELQAALPERQLQAQLQAQGPLAALPLKLDLAHGAAGRLQAEGEIAPLAAQPLRRLQGRLLALDPQALHPALPQGLWDGELSLQPQAQVLQLKASAANARALRLDEGGWPLRRLVLEAALDPADWTRSRIRALEAELGNARAGAGRLLLAPQALPRAGAALQAQLRVDAVRLSGLHQAWPALQLQGELDAAQAQLGQGALQLRTVLRALPLPGVSPLLGTGWRLNGEARWQDGVLELPELLVRELADTPARLQASGRLRLGAAPQLSLQAEARAWRLTLPPWDQPSQLEARAQLQLAQARGLWTGSARLQLLEGTRLAEQALQGDAEWQGDSGGARWQAKLLEGSGADTNRVDAEGRQPPRQLGHWQPERLRWQLPRLARLQTLAAPWVSPLGGSSSGEWSGDGLTGAGTLSLQNFRAATVQLDNLQAALRADRTLSLQLVKLTAPGLLLNEAQLDGSLAAGAALTLRAVADVAALREERHPPRSLVLQARSGAPLRDGEQWLLPDLSLQLGEAAGSSWLQLAQARLALQPDRRAVQLQAASLRVAGEPLDLQEARLAWPLQGALRLQGRPQLAPWLRLAQPEAGWGGDLRASLALALQQAPGGAPQVQLNLQRESGDLLLGKDALGLQQLALMLQQGAARDTALRAELAGSRLGQARLQLDTAAAGQALRGALSLNLPALEALQPWLRSAAPGLLLAGSAQAELGLSGSLAEPRAAGTASAQLTRALHAPSGVGLGAARLRLQLREESLRIEELSGEGLGKDGGTLRGDGELRWAGLRADQLDRLQGRMQLTLERLRLLQRFDRRLVASGELRAELLPRLLRLRGQLAADEGVFEIGRSDAPALDDDVRVLRPEQAGALPPRRHERGLPRLQRDVDLRVNLGERLRIAGRGLSSRLTGELRFVEQGGRPLQTTGLIELNGGRYRAYGQNLEIETGLLRFTGLLDNPRLDILAIRPNLETRVGVQVTGTAENPRVRLYSEPEMADSDKLAWLLLGRAPDELGRADTAILQRAALALLAGEGTNPAAELMDKLGLTELSLSQSDDAGTTLRLGAQLSKRWSLGYERSLDAASGSWQLVYRLGQRFRLRAQSGEQSAVDLLWLWRFD